MLWILIAEIGQGIDGIARAGHVKLHIAGPKMEVILNRQLHHSEPVEFMDQGFSLLQGILRTDHKPDLIQICPIINRLCDDQMTQMNRIKTAEKKPDFQSLGG